MKIENIREVIYFMILKEKRIIKKENHIDII